MRFSGSWGKEPYFEQVLQALTPIHVSLINYTKGFCDKQLYIMQVIMGSHLEECLVEWLLGPTMHLTNKSMWHTFLMMGGLRLPEVIDAIPVMLIGFHKLNHVRKVVWMQLYSKLIVFYFINHVWEPWRKSIGFKFFSCHEGVAAQHLTRFAQLWIVIWYHEVHSWTVYISSICDRLLERNLLHKI